MTRSHAPYAGFLMPASTYDAYVSLQRGTKPRVQTNRQKSAKTPHFNFPIWTFLTDAITPTNYVLDTLVGDVLLSRH